MVIALGASTSSRARSIEKNREDLPLVQLTTLYHREVGQVASLLSPEEVADLAGSIVRARARTNKETAKNKRLEDMALETREALQAKQRLVEANLRLVLRTVRKYKGFGVDLMDLIQEGNIGLMHAAEKFDPSKGSFSTYAIGWIRQYMTRALVEKTGMISVPYEKAVEAKRLARIRQNLQQQLQAEPTLEDLAKSMQRSVEQVVELMSTNQETYSLDQTGENGEETSIADEIEDDDPTSSPEPALLAQSLREQIRNLLTLLPEEEQQVLILRYGLGDESVHTLVDVLKPADGMTEEKSRPHSLSQTGALLGISHETVRQREISALQRLAPYCVALHLDAYLES